MKRDTHSTAPLMCGNDLIGVLGIKGQVKGQLRVIKGQVVVNTPDGTPGTHPRRLSSLIWPITVASSANLIMYRNKVVAE